MFWANTRYCMGDLSKERLLSCEDVAWEKTFMQDRRCGGKLVNVSVALLVFTLVPLGCYFYLVANM